MKVLALGHDFLDNRVVSVQFNNPQTILEFDAVVWWPTGLTVPYSTGMSSFQGKPRLNENNSFRLREDVARRRHEFLEFLRLGRTLVVVVPAPSSWWVDSGKKTHSGTGRNRQTTNLLNEMSVQDILPMELGLVAAHGEDVTIAKSGALTGFYQAIQDLLYYDAYLTESLGSEELVITGTPHVVGGVAPIEDGLLVAIPQINIESVEWEWEDDNGAELDEPRPVVDQDESRVVDALLELVSNLRPEVEELPEWAGRYVFEAELKDRAGQERVAAQLIRLQTTAAKLEAAIARLRERKLLFTSTGVPLEAIVQQAMEALGFQVEDGPIGRTDRVVTRKGVEAVVEVKGLEKSAAEKHSAQLQKWVSERHAEAGKEPKGILVANAWRNKPLEKRSQPAFPDQMLPYAERQRQALVTGIQLLCAWADAEANPSKADEIADSLLTCVGRWDRYASWQDFITPLEAKASPV